MTGFARAEGEAEGARWVWEVKSVNGRALDLKLRTPPGFDMLEQGLREQAAKRFKRGSLQANLTIARDGAAKQAARIDTAFIEAVLAAGKPFIESGQVAPPRWDGLLQLRGAFASEEAEAPDEEAKTRLNAALLAGFGKALDGLNEARLSEGKMLAEALGGQLDQMNALTIAARGNAASAPQAALTRIQQRLAGLSPDIQLDPQRLAQEAALAASRADIEEELERLAAHIAEARALLAKPEAVGRRLDFLGQELTREANTLCSKSGDLALTRIGLDLKALVDQFKEQAANVE
jgi:uncharacterized protein (TIGR00255 family)